MDLRSAFMALCTMTICCFNPQLPDGHLGVHGQLVAEDKSLENERRSGAFSDLLINNVGAPHHAEAKGKEEQRTTSSTKVFFPGYESRLPTSEMSELVDLRHALRLTHPDSPYALIQDVQREGKTYFTYTKHDLGNLEAREVLFVDKNFLIVNANLANNEIPQRDWPPFDLQQARSKLASSPGRRRTTALPTFVSPVQKSQVSHTHGQQYRINSKKYLPNNDLGDEGKYYGSLDHPWLWQRKPAMQPFFTHSGLEGRKRNFDDFKASPRLAIR